jgi:hypothetical protein
MRTFAEVIARWGSITQFAADIGAEYPTAAAWSQRNSIPPPWWPDVVRAAQVRGFTDITVAALATIAHDRPKRVKSRDTAAA